MQSTLERAGKTQGSRRSIVLPERLGTVGFSLALLDLAAAGIALALTARLFGDISGAIVTLTCLIAVALLLGRYVRSYAATGADAFYATVAAAILGGSVGALLALGLGRNLGAPIAAIVTWSIVAGIASAYTLHKHHAGRKLTGQVGSVDDWSAHSRSTAFAIRVCDLVFASIALALFLPVMAVVALAVLIDSGKPVLFRQDRVGRNGSPFTMYKFRTMRLDAGKAWVRPGDSRITSVGAFLRRTSLDELPQLFNVLRGEMSLVGPRPEMPEYADRFAHEERAYAQRHFVRPGITGWAQLHLPRNLQPSDMPVVLRYDLFYVQNCELLLYVSCLVKTALEVLAHRAV